MSSVNFNFFEYSHILHKHMYVYTPLQVSNTCEKQMASQHKLAQSVHPNYSNVMEGTSNIVVTIQLMS